MFCPHCGEKIVEGAQFCGMCGSDIGKPAASPPPPRRPPPQRREEDVPVADYAPQRRPPPPERSESGGDDSMVFAIITLVAYFVFWPAGLVMNIVGLFSSQKKGCFVWMMVVFILLPIILFVLLLGLGVFAAAVSEGGPPPGRF